MKASAAPGLWDAGGTFSSGKSATNVQKESVFCCADDATLKAGVGGNRCRRGPRHRQSFLSCPSCLSLSLDTRLVPSDSALLVVEEADGLQIGRTSIRSLSVSPALQKQSALAQLDPDGGDE